MLGYFDLILWPLLATFVLTGIHVYLGLHVVSRGVIFVDLALAQVAALGTAIGILIGLGHDSVPTYLIALGFTFIGALLFAITRSKNGKVPQEAIIGITYVVAAAMMIVLFSKSPKGAEHLNHLLVGSILFVTPKIVGVTFVLYTIIGLFHWFFRKKFFEASKQYNNRELQHTKIWDFLFYITFGFVVTSSVKIAGVLLVFSFLIIPAVTALLFVNGNTKRLVFGWVFGILGSILGMLVSVIFDIPTGASIVVTFGGMLSVLGIVKQIKSKN
ncbi:MAG: metal ABC transporter permease [Candidatus Marinimicrobia bacterium]|nr:metal ABC transporter permease [Candidatus Neomarinimicrobiota bacterium]MBL7022490.1 metal ABC transporter permease [Candidatus Neomarinimicrobiota bacterium]MBL7108655.1 metal ABC transporter permease [Candidatus Neomarinimicrobiota bacterium]